MAKICTSLVGEILAPIKKKRRNNFADLVETFCTGRRFVEGN